MMGSRRASTITVAHLFDRWREDVLSHQVSPLAADNDFSVAKHHIIPTLGRKKLLDLTTADIDRLIAKKLSEGKSVSTVRRIRSVFAQALDQAMRWGWGHAKRCEPQPSSQGGS